MKPRRTWILVADGARARILETEGPGTGLRAALNFQFAEPHASSHEMGTERLGRTNTPGTGQPHAVEPKHDWHTFQKHLFAAHVAEALDKAKDAFDDLVLVAPPKALGELRKALSHAIKTRVKGELDKDLTHLTIHEMADHLSGIAEY